MVTDPYFGQNAVDAGLMKTFGRTFGDVMILLLIAFIMNILLVRFQKYTKLRAVLQQGMFRFNKQLPLSGFTLLFSNLGRIEVLIFMGLILGCYWAVASNLTVGITQELTEGAGFAVAASTNVWHIYFCKISRMVEKT